MAKFEEVVSLIKTKQRLYASVADDWDWFMLSDIDCLYRDAHSALPYHLMKEEERSLRPVKVICLCGAGLSTPMKSFSCG